MVKDGKCPWPGLGDGISPREFKDEQGCDGIVDERRNIDLTSMREPL